MRFIILPTQEISLEFRSALENWCERNQFTLPPNIPDQAYRDVVHAIVYNYMDGKMNWIKVRHDRVQSQFEKSFSMFEGILPHGWYDRIFYDIIDDIELQIDQYMNRFIPSSTWRIYHLRMIGGDTVIERGEDYRVVDWTRRHENGEIKLDDQ